jgi:hypothetical protein
MRGGKRIGAGRKKGFVGIEAELARIYIAEKVSASLSEIVEALVRKAREGDVRAAQVLLDRAYGRVDATSAMDATTSISCAIIIRTPVQTEHLAANQAFSTAIL